MHFTIASILRDFLGAISPRRTLSQAFVYLAKFALASQFASIKLWSFHFCAAEFLFSSRFHLIKFPRALCRVLFCLPAYAIHRKHCVNYMSTDDYEWNMLFSLRFHFLIKFSFPHPPNTLSLSLYRLRASDERYVQVFDHLYIFFNYWKSPAELTRLCFLQMSTYIIQLRRGLAPSPWVRRACLNAQSSELWLRKPIFRHVFRSKFKRRWL